MTGPRTRRPAWPGNAKDTAVTPGAIVMAYGTPARLDDVEAFYTHVRRGRPPSAEQLAELRERYESIGGLSPLVDRTDAQRAAIDRALPAGWSTVVGMKHAAPFVEDAVTDLAQGDHDPIVGVALAPHWSVSVAEYHERAEKTAGELGIAYQAVESWHDLDAWISFQAAAVRGARVGRPARSLQRSLAPRAGAAGRGSAVSAGGERQSDRCRGRARFRPLAGRLAERGAHPEPWRGPDVCDELRRLADQGEEAVVVCPQGFTSDNLELLHDLDVQAATWQTGWLRPHPDGQRRSRGHGGARRADHGHG